MESVSVGFWSVIPPLVAITLALLTKEVVFSLVLGILSGSVIYTLAADLPLISIFTTPVNLMLDKMSGNVALLVFPCLLGALVALITKAGGSRAYGEWAASKLKSKTSASVATGLLGCLIFIDDYFNCFTVGTVMRPVTDKYGLSREKLAYLIDATAAPICIIAPISSWAASVISYFPTDGSISGMTAFLSSIPMNLYAILSIIMVFWMATHPRGDFGPMAIAERRAMETGDLGADDEAEAADAAAHAESAASTNGRVIDLVLPILVLIALSVYFMIYLGYEYGGTNLFEAFGNTDASLALAIASFCTLIFAFLMFVPRKLMSFHQFFDTLVEGIKSMLPAAVILSLAWTISGVCRDLLVTGEFVGEMVQTSNMPVAVIPAIMFLIAGVLSFATGTSWGTFGLLIPIILDVCSVVAPELTITALSSILAGSVFGDHCSPISDTTIMSSTGAGCRHIDHVATQMPYAVTCAAVCFVGYLVAGFTYTMGYGISLVITDAVAIIGLLAVLMIMPKVWTGKKAA